MAYLEVIKEYPPYRAAKDKRGFISRYYGAGGHSGVDSVGNLWDMPVCAMFDGKITSAGYTTATGYDVTYQSENGRVKVVYLHLREKAVSGNVKKDQVIGYEGNTGTVSRGKHLHISLYIDGIRVDPLPYLKGTKPLPLEQTENKEEVCMVRKVIRNDLNLRSGAGAGNPSYGMIPVGTLINVTETKKVSDGSTWGRHTCVMADGKTYTGWSNLGNTWSADYTGALSGGGLEKENAALKAKIANAQAALK